MASLESRCVSLAWAIGAEGVQNGGIDGASVAGTVPDGFRELFAENLMVMVRGLESCSGNDTLVSESDLRRMARTFPTLHHTEHVDDELGQLVGAGEGIR